MICFAALMGLAQVASAQVHTASFTGNWSDPSIWGPNGAPPQNCNNCTITINDGVFVTLDISYTIKGTSRINIGSSGTVASALIIPGTNQTSISTSNNIILNSDGGGHPSIKLLTTRSSLTVTRGPGILAKYDGVFIQFPPDEAYNKLVGYSPSAVASDGMTSSLNVDPPYLASLPNSKFPNAPIVINSDGTLPILLASFDAVLSEGVVNLTWTTSLEINSGHFSIERSSDGTNWQSIGTVAAKGFSSIAVNYSYNDESPLNGVSYYRLQMVDADGKYKYSPVKVIRGSNTKGLSVFPNPAKSFVNVTLGSDINTDLTIRLINQFGQRLLEQRLSHSGGRTITIPVSNFAQGNYVLQAIGADGSRQTFKVVIVK